MENFQWKEAEQKYAGWGDIRWVRWLVQKAEPYAERYDLGKK